MKLPGVIWKIGSDAWNLAITFTYGTRQAQIIAGKYMKNINITSVINIVD
jgi:hypothetical protein